MRFSPALALTGLNEYNLGGNCKGMSIRFASSSYNEAFGVDAATRSREAVEIYDCAAPTTVR